MEQILEFEKTFLEEYEAAKLLISRKMIKSATILLSKSLFALIDYLILKKYHQLPKNHTERFRILRIKEHDIYVKLDSVWSKYTDSYSKPPDTESVTLFLNIIQEVIKNNEIFSEGIKKIIET